MRKLAPQRFSRSYLPELGLIALAGRQDGFAVRAERCGKNCGGMHQGSTQRSSRGGLPEPSSLVAASQDDPAIGAKSAAHDIALMPKRLTEWPAGGYLTQPGGLVSAPGQDN